MSLEFPSGQRIPGEEESRTDSVAWGGERVIPSVLTQPHGLPRPEAS